MDTANDLRIRFYEALAAKLEKYVRSGVLKDREGVVSRLSSLVKEMKYSYLDARDLISVYGERLAEIAEKIRNLHAPSESMRRLLFFVSAELLDFPRKFSRHVSEPFEVFRFALAEVVSVSKHPSLPNLRVTRVRDGKGNVYTVITNIPNVKEGEKAAVVFLPPKEFGGVWSEAMFVKLGIEKPEDLSLDDLRSLNSYYHEIIVS